MKVMNNTPKNYIRKRKYIFLMEVEVYYLQQGSIISPSLTVVSVYASIINSIISMSFYLYEDYSVFLNLIGKALMHLFSRKW